MAATKFENIIWDWNGTLLNDVAICIQSMNHLLVARNLPQLNEKSYREIFTFPVQKYYESIGFDFSAEQFAVPAMQFIDHYAKLLPSADLFSEAKQILKFFKNKNFNQYILSAMEQESLENSVKNLKIEGYFNKIYGIQDHYARSKVERGFQLIKNEEMNITKTVLVGDTLHDLEVAGALGISCILVSQGHYAENRLRNDGYHVIPCLNELKQRL